MYNGTSKVSEGSAYLSIHLMAFRYNSLFEMQLAYYYLDILAKEWRMYLNKHINNESLYLCNYQKYCGLNSCH